MTQPPPLPPRPNFQPAIAPPSGPSIGLIVGGAAITIGAEVGVLFVAMALTTLLRIDNVFAFFGINCVISLAIGLPLALWLQRNPRTRGWAIGIYTGLGIAMAFWAVAALFIAILVIGTPSR